MYDANAFDPHGLINDQIHYEGYEQYGPPLLPTQRKLIESEFSSFRFFSDKSINKLEIQPGQKISMIVDGRVVVHRNTSPLTQIMEGKIESPKKPFAFLAPLYDTDSILKRDGRAFEITINDGNGENIVSISKNSRKSEVSIAAKNPDSLNVSNLSKKKMNLIALHLFGLGRLQVYDRKSMTLDPNGVKAYHAYHDVHQSLLIFKSITNNGLASNTVPHDNTQLNLDRMVNNLDGLPPPAEPLT